MRSALVILLGCAIFFACTIHVKLDPVQVYVDASVKVIPVWPPVSPDEPVDAGDDVSDDAD